MDAERGNESDKSPTWLLHQLDSSAFATEERELCPLLLHNGGGRETITLVQAVGAADGWVLYMIFSKSNGGLLTWEGERVKF